MVDKVKPENKKKKSTSDKILKTLKIPFVAIWVSFLKLWGKAKE